MWWWGIQVKKSGGYRKAFFLDSRRNTDLQDVQLKEALDQRMGCVVVSPSGCGKSTVACPQGGLD